MAVIHGRGAVVRQPGSPARVEDITIEDPGPGEVRVRMLTSGVCHTDLFAKEGKFGAAFPYLLGHEATGIVESVGDHVSRPTAGQTVTLSWRAPCGVCRFCVRGDSQVCPSALTAQPRMKTHDGITLGRVLGLGTFADYTVVAADQAIPMKETLDPAATCLVGCAVGTGVGAALYSGKATPGSTVAVFGCGAVGISVIQGARIAHASRIIGVDIAPSKLEWAKTFGATDTVDAREGDPVEAIRMLTDGLGVDFAFEAVGTPQAVEQTIASCDIAGTAVLIGVPAQNSQITLPLAKFFFNRGRLRATSYGDIVARRDFPLFASLYQRGDLALDKMVSERIGLDDVEDAFAAMQRGETIRSVIVFD